MWNPHASRCPDPKPHTLDLTPRCANLKWITVSNATHLYPFNGTAWNPYVQAGPDDLALLAVNQTNAVPCQPMTMGGARGGGVLGVLHRVLGVLVPSTNPVVLPPTDVHSPTGGLPPGTTFSPSTHHIYRCVLAAPRGFPGCRSGCTCLTWVLSLVWLV